MSPLDPKATIPQDDATDGGAAPAGGDVGPVTPSTPISSDDAAADGGAAPAPDELPASAPGQDTGAPAVGAFTDGGPAPEPPTGRSASSGEGVS